MKILNGTRISWHLIIINHNHYNDHKIKRNEYHFK